MIRKFRNLAADERGTSLIEMAMVAPVLAAMLMGMSDLARAYSDKLQLEQAAQRSIERAMNRQMSSTTYNSLVAEAADAADVPADDVTVDFWRECNGARQTEYNANCAPGEVQSRYLTVTVEKAFEPMFGVQYFPGANEDGTFTIEAEAGIRTQ